MAASFSQLSVFRKKKKNATQLESGESGKGRKADKEMRTIWRIVPQVFVAVVSTIGRVFDFLALRCPIVWIGFY